MKPFRVGTRPPLRLVPSGALAIAMRDAARCAEVAEKKRKRQLLIAGLGLVAVSLIGLFWLVS